MANTEAIKREAALTLSATLRVLPLIAIVAPAILWAADQYLVNESELERAFIEQRITNLEDKLHTIKSKELRGTADLIDMSDKARYEQEIKRKQEELGR